MNATIQTAQAAINPVDALWAIFMSQTKKVRKEFAERIIASEYNTITPSLAKQIAKVEKNMKEGKTIHFDTVEQLDKFLDTL